MRLQDLERIIRLAVTGESRPTLAALAGGAADDGTLDREFRDAIRSLAGRSGKPGKADDHVKWQ